MPAQKTPEVLIIGATNAGFAACSSLVAAKPDWKVTLLAQDDDLPYNCDLLPDYLEGKIEKREIMLCEESFFSGHNVEFTRPAAVSGIDFSRQRVYLRNNRRLAYDYLIVAGGRKPALDIPGKGKEGVFVFFGLSDADEIRRRLSIPGNVVVCGRADDSRRLAGLFSSAGRTVKLLLKEGGEFSNLPGDNPEVLCGTDIEEIIGEGKELKAVRLSGGKIVEAASVIFCRRGNPCMDFAAGGEAKIENGRIKTGGNLRAGVDNVFACGEAAAESGAEDARLQGIRAADEILAAESGKTEAVV